MAEIEKAKQIKINCKSRLTKFKTFLDKCLNVEFEEVDVEEIKLRYKKIEETWNEYDKAQTVVELLALGQSREDERTEFEDNYFKYSSIAIKIINQKPLRDSSSDSNANNSDLTAQRNRIEQLELELNSRRDFELETLREIVARTQHAEVAAVRTHFPLPKLDLPTFSGGYDEWLGFRDSFSAMIDKDDSIPKIQKLRFLRSYLKGNAARVIDNLETSEANYDVVWRLLGERYDNKKIIIQNHTQALFELSIVSKESSFGLRNLLDSALRHVRALKVLGQPTDSWDTLLIYLIITKLDRETRKEWERSVTGNKMTTFDQLTKFLNEKCQMLEALNPQSSDQCRVNSRSENKQSFSGNKGHSSKTFVNTQTSGSCLICKEDHYVNSCPEFIRASPIERMQIVKKKSLCFNCLRRNHLINECKSGNCSVCNRRHHTLLHIDYKHQSTTEETKITNNKDQIKNLHVLDASKVLLSTAVVDVLDSTGNKHVCRIMLVSGSQPNLITEKLANFLNLERTKLKSSIEAVNNVEITSSDWVVANFQSRSSNYATKLSLLVLPEITSNTPAVPINKNILKILKHIRLSDQKFNEPAKVEALIGAELFYELLGTSKILLALPGTALQSTKLGWIVTGKVHSNRNQQRLKCHLVKDHLRMQLENFWRIEEREERRYLSKEEEACENHFSSNVQRDSSGRYMVRLPFNEKREELGASYDVARRRFFALERRLMKNSDLKEQYHQFLEEYEALGHMERIGSRTDEGYYMPHQAVVRESSLTTKLRVVFDASAKTSTKISLNDALMVGPTIQDGIFTLILRFRKHPFALGADIEKMYRQFWVHPEDRKYQKILWRYDTDEPLKTYQMKTVTYGTSAAPFPAVRCLKQLAEDERASFPNAAKVLESDFYVVDLLTGADTLEDAKQLRDELIKLTNKGGLRLCKWISSNEEVIKELPDCSSQTNLKLDPDHAAKTLGVAWDSKEDTLIFEVSTVSDHEIISKRAILSQIAKLYDPLGLLAPVIIYAKIKLQELWKTGTNWDDPVPPEISASWRKYQRQLHLKNNWKIQRAVRVPDADEIQLHGFADASKRAYGACIYLCITKNNEHHSILLCAKSRVAPTKTLSMPRLELCAAVLLANLYKTVKSSLRIEFHKIRLWSDSTITLNRIGSSLHEFKTFVANRIAEIQDLTSITDWKHVATRENPADYVSRGQLPQEFACNTLWRNRPVWLTQAESHWPNHLLKNSDEVEDKKKGVTILTVAIGGTKFHLWTRFSSLKKLLRVTAYCLRYIEKLRGRSSRFGSLMSNELQKALY